jgi:hypothetical protein
MELYEFAARAPNKKITDDKKLLERIQGDPDRRTAQQKNKIRR